MATGGLFHDRDRSRDRPDLFHSKYHLAREIFRRACLSAYVMIPD